MTRKLLSSLVIAIFAGCVSPPTHAADTAKGVDAVIDALLKLEQNREPKCYATASRLEDFMYGTPLSAEARFAKNLLQKQWVDWMWRAASDNAEAANHELVTSADIQDVLKSHWTVTETPGGHFQVQLNGRTVQVHSNDKRQYSSVAYSLRAVLAIQQELLLNPADDRLLLDQEAVEALAGALDFLSLAVIKITDEKARLENQREVTAESMAASWLALSGQPQDEATTSPAATPDDQLADLSLLRRMIEQKLASYEAYNKVSNQLFMRNLQVYFARARWPRDEAESLAFRQAFTEAMIQFTADLWRGAEKDALTAKRNHIGERDVAHFADQFIPNRINHFEDAVFFPRLPREQQVEIEAYDMDAFRDPGWHWRYLSAAIDSPDFKPRLPLDPFAAELLTENVAQFGVLLLRLAGEETHRRSAEEISRSDLAKAFATIRNRVDTHAAVDSDGATTETIASADEADDQADSGQALFTDVSQAAGIQFEHRNSDWLNRQLRSYLKKDAETGVITIPPAFGGGGAAADDINNDGLPDILLLSGRGNRLYLNQGKGQFKDITEHAGIDWRREDTHLPGEPRQPLIADLDNDGLRDIVVTYVDDSHRVYRNVDGTRFEDVTDRAGLGGKGLVGGPATVFDFDNDGLLDLYVQNFGDYLHGVLPTLARRNFNASPDRLFRNTGNFRFVDVTEKAGIGDPGWGQATSHTDINGDGKQDLISGNDFGINRYYINQGDGTFKDMAPELGTDKPSFTMSIGITDLNRDLRPDIYIANIVTMNKDETYVMPNADTPAKFNVEKLKNLRVIESNDLFVSSRAKKSPTGWGWQYQASDAVARGIDSTGWSWDADFFDADNDGDEDLYVLTGMNDYFVYSRENPYYTDPKSDQQQAVTFPDAGADSNVYFENKNGKLIDASRSSGLNFAGNSRSAAYLDIDGDGDLDIVTNDYQGPARLLLNKADTLGNHWIGINLIGDPAQGVNRDAVGARIVAKFGKQQAMREVRGSEGYMSVHPKRQTIGLGKSEAAEIEIVWPNGKHQSVGQLAAGKIHTISMPKPDA